PTWSPARPPGSDGRRRCGCATGSAETPSATATGRSEPPRPARSPGSGPIRGSCLTYLSSRGHNRLVDPLDLGGDPLPVEVPAAGDTSFDQGRALHVVAENLGDHPGEV